MARPITLEPMLPVADIQGDLLGGFPKKAERLLFFTIDDIDAFREFVHDLELTSSAEVLAKIDLIKTRKAAGNDTLVPAPGLNVAFTYKGLLKLGKVDGSTPNIKAFRGGMAGSQGKLADPPADEWQIQALRPGRPEDDELHGVFILTGASTAEIANVIALNLAPVHSHGFRVVHQESGTVRPDPAHGHEHFGYADGVSQPGIRGQVAPGVPLTPQQGDDENQGVPGQDLLWPGEFVFGYPQQNGGAEEFVVEGDVLEPPVEFMRNGAFLVFRRLRQYVPEFDLAVKDSARSIDGGADPATAEQLGAQMVGRWKSGAPLVEAPLQDDPAIDESQPLKVNDFEFGGDVDGLRCPFAAHVRKVYPRDDLTPGATSVKKAEAGTQTHRMLRRGIAFGPELTEEEAESGTSADDRQRGLLFLCFVTSIEEQFEFVQQFWVDNEDFVQPGSGIDPLIGQPFGDGLDKQKHLFRTGAPKSLDKSRKAALQFGRFVEMQGGEYFFTPSISAVKGL